MLFLVDCKDPLYVNYVHFPESGKWFVTRAGIFIMMSRTFLCIYFLHFFILVVMIWFSAKHICVTAVPINNNMKKKSDSLIILFWNYIRNRILKEIIGEKRLLSDTWINFCAKYRSLRFFLFMSGETQALISRALILKEKNPRAWENERKETAG